MVRKYSTEDRITFDQPVEPLPLVPWKQLASSPRTIQTPHNRGSVFDFIHEKTKVINSPSTSVASPTFPPTEDETSKDSSPSSDQHESDESNASADLPRSARGVSPMQEKLKLEQQWQKNLVKIDSLLSDFTAPNKGEFNESIFYSTFKNKEFLSLLYKLFDWDCESKVSQEKILDCCRRTFVEHGGREWVDLLEVVTYVICEERSIVESYFIKIFKSKGVVEKLYKYISGLSVNEAQASRQTIMDLIANLTYARPRTGFSAENLERLERMFRDALGSRQELSFEDFKKILHSRNPFFAERVFHIFDRDKNGSVSLSEFLDAMHQFTGQTPNDKIKFLFRVYDIDGDGLIQLNELQEVLKECMAENGMRFSDDQIEDLTIALLEDADTEQRGEITFEALKAQLEKHPGLIENLSISIDRWLVPPSAPAKNVNFVDKLKRLRPYQLTLPYLRNNYVYLSFLSFFIAVNVGLFIDRGLEIYYKDDLPPELIRNLLYVFARACGQCLNFNCAFILILILRQSITFLRAHGAAFFLPLDQHLYLHKMCGWVVFFHSMVHTIMHLINFPVYVVYSEAVNPNNYTTVEWLFTSRPGLFGLVPGWANPTGIILIVVLTIMVICSLPFVRKSGYFEVFYWTHLLYVVFWVLTILHGPKFWKWFVAPAVIFIIEKVYRWCSVRTGHGKTYISSGILLPSKVIHLLVQKPYNFHYHPGDYVYVNIPQIANYEWHPFTISSAPEQDGVLWLHIRAVGEWTNRLLSYFDKQQLKCERNRLTTRNTSRLSIQYSNDKNIMISVADSAVQFRDKQPLANTDAPQDRKSGVANVAFEPDNGIDISQASNTTEKPLFKKPLKEKIKLRAILSKKHIDRVKSVPDLDNNRKRRERKMISRENWRNNSATLITPTDLEQGYQIVNDVTNKKIVFSSNKSVAMSVRYMRRKPRVVTLDMPHVLDEEEEEANSKKALKKVEEDSSTRSDSESEDDGGQDHDVEAPKPTSVKRSSGGRIFDLREEKRAAREQQLQKRKSRHESDKARRISRLKEAEHFGQCTLGKPLVIHIDGPYGAPSSHIFRAQHAVLIGTGIGVTPFASILQSIMYQYLKNKQTCPKCEYSWTRDMSASIMNLKKVDFFWINRDQRSFEWFVNLLSQLEIEQAEKGGMLERFLDMHMYITSVLQKTDMKAVGLQLALDLLHEKEKRDLITGLKTRTNAGRPNWDKVFKQLSNQRKGKITVFYCGPPALGRILRYKCDEFGFDYKKEIF